MTTLNDVALTKKILLERLETLDTKADILKAPELKKLYAAIKDIPQPERADFGRAVNNFQDELRELVAGASAPTEDLRPIDITAPFDINGEVPDLLSVSQGSSHPLTEEISKIAGIFERMGFMVLDSREIDDQYHMFEALNFPLGHPARDDYDTFMTTETDKDGHAFVAPAHTSTMQHRILSEHASSLASGEPIAAVVPDRVFRNEDLDARHEHTFYQIEGLYVGTRVHAGMLIATLQAFLQEYFDTSLNVRVNPFYFPFTEPSFEFALSCPFCEGADASCKVCSGEGWIELLGCGMIHPNVLREAGIDPNQYTGFAFGCGVDRLVMMKHGIEDVRHFHSAKLDFLRQF